MSKEDNLPYSLLMPITFPLRAAGISLLPSDASAASDRFPEKRFTVSSSAPSSAKQNTGTPVQNTGSDMPRSE